MPGHIHKRVGSHAGGRKTTRWYVVVELGRDADGRRRQKWHGGYHTRREADTARARLVNEINTRVYAAPTKVTPAQSGTPSE
jgi:Arm DNA-binding domain